jgi:hypothetical protein
VGEEEAAGAGEGAEEDEGGLECQLDGELTLFDFLAFQNLFSAGDPGRTSMGTGS